MKKFTNFLFALPVLPKLAALAEKYQCAIVLVGHMNKAAGNKAAYRGMGSIDFFAVARSVLLVGRVEGEENVRAVVQIKNNLEAFGHSKAFALSENDRSRYRPLRNGQRSAKSDRLGMSVGTDKGK